MENSKNGLICKVGQSPILFLEVIMIRSVKLILSGGYYDIIYGDGFSVSGKVSQYLEYEKNGIWYVKSNPYRGSEDDTLITVPYDFEFKSFVLKLNEGAAKVCPINCEKAYFEINNSAVEISDVSAERIGLALGKGNVVINSDPAIEMDIDCGFGTVDLRLKKSCDGYFVKSKRGMGEIILNSVRLPRQYENNEGKRVVNVICGMGKVNINT